MVTVFLKPWRDDLRDLPGALRVWENFIGEKLGPIEEGSMEVYHGSPGFDSNPVDTEKNFFFND